MSDEQNNNIAALYIATDKIGSFKMSWMEIKPEPHSRDKECISPKPMSENL